MQHAAPIEEKLNQIAAGVIPSELDELAHLANTLLAINAKTRQTISVIIARAKELLQLREWIDWCAEQFDLDTAARSHMAAVGRLLLTCQQENKVYRKLFPLDFEKLYALTAIPDQQAIAAIIPFIDDLPKMNRAEVRAKVNEILGREPRPPAQQLTLPGFDDFVEKVVTADVATLAMTVQNPTQAGKAIQAGQRIINSAVVYYHSQQDVLELHKLKNYLRNELVADLETAITMLASDNGETETQP